MTNFERFSARYMFPLVVYLMCIAALIDGFYMQSIWMPLVLLFYGLLFKTLIYYADKNYAKDNTNNNSAN